MKRSYHTWERALSQLQISSLFPSTCKQRNKVSLSITHKGTNNRVNETLRVNDWKKYPQVIITYHHINRAPVEEEGGGGGVRRRRKKKRRKKREETDSEEDQTCKAKVKKRDKIWDTREIQHLHHQPNSKNSSHNQIKHILTLRKYLPRHLQCDASSYS